MDNSFDINNPAILFVAEISRNFKDIIERKIEAIDNSDITNDSSRVLNSFMLLNISQDIKNSIESSKINEVVAEKSVPSSEEYDKDDFESFMTEVRESMKPSQSMKLS